jgi:hypothetical protein
MMDDELGLFDDVGTCMNPILQTARDPTDGGAGENLEAPRELVEYPKRGSSVSEEPFQEYVQRYAKFDVTPPSKKIQAGALPTPNSHPRPFVTISPSPAGRSAASGQANQSDIMVPSASQEYEVEEILQQAEISGVTYYLVKWRGYPHDDDSWEPEGNLTHASDALRKFEVAMATVES